MRRDFGEGAVRDYLHVHMPRRVAIAITLMLFCLCISTQAAAAKIMIFGGYNHATYLGCLNCSTYAMDSVLNSYGSYGSPYGMNSIFNHYSQFGSPYSMYSACNPYASDPPVIVDEAGYFYGRLTINLYNSQVTHDQNMLNWLANSVCGDS